MTCIVVVTKLFYNKTQLIIVTTMRKNILFGFWLLSDLILWLFLAFGFNPLAFRKPRKAKGLTLKAKKS